MNSLWRTEELVVRGVRRGKKWPFAYNWGCVCRRSVGRNELVKIFTDNAVITQMQRQLRARPRLAHKKAHLGRGPRRSFECTICEQGTWVEGRAHPTSRWICTAQRGRRLLFSEG